MSKKQKLSEEIYIMESLLDVIKAKADVGNTHGKYSRIVKAHREKLANAILWH